MVYINKVREQAALLSYERRTYLRRHSFTFTDYSEDSIFGVANRIVTDSCYSSLKYSLEIDH